MGAYWSGAYWRVQKTALVLACSRVAMMRGNPNPTPVEVRDIWDEFLTGGGDRPPDELRVDESEVLVGQSALVRLCRAAASTNSWHSAWGVMFHDRAQPIGLASFAGLIEEANRANTEVKVDAVQAMPAPTMTPSSVVWEFPGDEPDLRRLVTFPLRVSVNADGVVMVSRAEMGRANVLRLSREQAAWLREALDAALETTFDG